MMWEQLHYRNVFEAAWENYFAAFPSDADQKLEALTFKKGNITKDSFALYSSIASVFSSKIEGEDIQLDSYFKHRFQAVQYEPDYTKRPDDLYNAYEFASENELNYTNLVHVHKIITNNILPSDKRGAIRTQQMFISDNQGNIRYVAAEAGIVKDELLHLLNDIEILKKSELSNAAMFYSASFCHLLFAKIHPMYDGNGRIARLVEKWFLSHFIGKTAWNIESERFYYEHLKEYYTALNLIGVDYSSSDYSKSLPFLQMLVKSL